MTQGAETKQCSLLGTNMASGGRWNSDCTDMFLDLSTTLRFVIYLSSLDTSVTADDEVRAAVLVAAGAAVAVALTAERDTQKENTQ